MSRLRLEDILDACPECWQLVDVMELQEFHGGVACERCRREEERLVAEQMDYLEDLDPYRTVTHLVENTPTCCSEGHADCYDSHSAERAADEADLLSDSERDSRGT